MKQPPATSDWGALKSHAVCQMSGLHAWTPSLASSSSPSLPAAAGVVRLGVHLSLGPFHGRKFQPCFYGQETCSLLSHYLSLTFCAHPSLCSFSCDQILPCTQSTMSTWCPSTVKCTAQASWFLCTSKTALKPGAFWLGKQWCAHTCWF